MSDNLLVKIASALDKYKIPYMIIGGQAVLLYGEPRLTKDIDITLGVDLRSLSVIQKIRKELKLKDLSTKIEDFTKKTLVLPLYDAFSGMRVDFIFSYSDYERNAIKRAKSIKIDNKKINFISIEDLIIQKIFAGRPRDLEDARSIIRKNSKIEKKYVIKWLKIFDKSNHNEKFSLVFQKIVKGSK